MKRSKRSATDSTTTGISQARPQMKRTRVSSWFVPPEVVYSASCQMGRVRSRTSLVLTVEPIRVMSKSSFKFRRVSPRLRKTTGLSLRLLRLSEFWGSRATPEMRSMVKPSSPSSGLSKHEMRWLVFSIRKAARSTSGLLVHGRSFGGGPDPGWDANPGLASLKLPAVSANGKGW